MGGRKEKGRKGRKEVKKETKKKETKETFSVAKIGMWVRTQNGNSRWKEIVAAF